MIVDSRAAWADFWSNGDGPQVRGCLPQAGAAINESLTGEWRRFARKIAPRGSVLDLGTGDGVVLTTLGKARRDLRLIGVDSAPTLPPTAKPIKLHTGVSNEQLPFAAGRFDAVTSQFAIEYGQVSQSVSELARVLAPAGQVMLVIHHSGSAIVRHNRLRRDALAWITREAPLLAMARKFAAARAILRSSIPTSFATAAAAARERFPDQSVAEEVSLAIFQALQLGERNPGQDLALLDRIELRSAMEIARLDLLAGAARDAPGIETIGRELAGAGLRLDPVRELVETNGSPFAWLIEGTHGPASVP